MQMLARFMLHGIESKYCTIDPRVEMRYLVGTLPSSCSELLDSSLSQDLLISQHFLGFLARCCNIFTETLNMEYIHHSSKRTTHANHRLRNVGEFSLPSLTPSQEELVAHAIETAVVEVGYLHIDTAYIYGTEKVIGRTLKKLMDDGIVRRDNIFITTKLPGIGMTPEKVGYFLELQLKNLQLDYVDLYLIHSPIGIIYHDDETFWPMTSNDEVNLDLKTNLVAVWKAMEAEVDVGRVKSIGISNFRESQILRIVENARILPSNLQVELSVFLQQNDLREICKEYGIVVSAYSPLGSPGAVNQLTAIGAEDKKVDILNDAVIAQISAKHNKTPAQIALKFLIQQGIAVLPKSFTPARLHENFQIFDFTLDAKDMESLKTLDRGENGRVFQWKSFLNYRDHPECPN